jgi:hypothetical protein
MATLHPGATGHKRGTQSNESKQATALGPPEGDFTVNEWCRKRHVSRATFYRMKKRGETPVVIRVSGRYRITPQADAAWEAEAAADEPA